MTVQPVQMAAECRQCGEPVTVLRDHGTGHDILLDFGTTQQHCHQTDEDWVPGVFRCPVCGTPDVAQTTRGRVVEWGWGGPILPFIEHGCVPSLMKEPETPSALEGSEVFDL